MSQIESQEEKRAARGDRWVEVALPLGAATLIGTPRTGGFAWAGFYRNQSTALVALIRRAISIGDDCP